MFQKSVSRMLLDNEAWISKFRVILIEQSILKFSFLMIKDKTNGYKLRLETDVEKKNQTGWSRIGLSYRVEWPFHSLITKKVLKK